MSIGDTELFSEQSTPNSSVTIRFRKTSTGAYARYETYDADGVASHYGMTVLNPSTYATIAESVSTGFFVTPQYIGWRKDATSPTLIHQPQTTDVACTGMTITSQAPYASATGTNRNPGNLTLTVPAPAAGGSTGLLTVNIGATSVFYFTAGSIVPAVPAMTFSQAVASPTISHETRSTDAATTSTTIAAQAPYASATGTNRNAGSVVITSPAPAAGGAAGTIDLNTAGAMTLQVAGPALFIANTTAAPGSNPVGGGYLYVDAGALKYRGSSGTVTPLANA